MDTAFQTAPFPGMTNDQLKYFCNSLRGTHELRVKAFDELQRRAMVVDGDVSVMTPGERLRLVQAKRIAPDDRNAQLVRLQLNSPMRPPTGRTHDVDGLALFDTARQPRLI